MHLAFFLIWSFPRFWLWRMKLIYTNIRSHKKIPKVFTKSSTIITGVIYIYIYIYMGLTKIVSPKSSGVSMFIVIKSVCPPQTGGVFEKPASWGYNLMRSYSKKTTWWKIDAAKNHDVYHGISGFPQLFWPTHRFYHPSYHDFYRYLFIDTGWVGWICC